MGSTRGGILGCLRDFLEDLNRAEPQDHLLDPMVVHRIIDTLLSRTSEVFGFQRRHIVRVFGYCDEKEEQRT